MNFQRNNGAKRNMLEENKYFDDEDNDQADRPIDANGIELKMNGVDSDDDVQLGLPQNNKKAKSCWAS